MKKTTRRCTFRPPGCLEQTTPWYRGHGAAATNHLFTGDRRRGVEYGNGEGS
jgi:hypothetical protein